MIKLTFLTIPRSPWRASTGFKKIVIRPSEFIVATNLSPILPLLPTPITTILPPALCDSTVASTAWRKPWRHFGSVAYSRERHDSAVASVASTWVAVDRIFSARRSRPESVVDRVMEASTCDAGGDGFWGDSSEGEGEGEAREAVAAAAAAAEAAVVAMETVVVRAGACWDMIEGGEA